PRNADDRHAGASRASGEGKDRVAPPQDYSRLPRPKPALAPSRPMNVSCAWAPIVIQDFISAPGAIICRFACMRLVISSTRLSLSSVTSGRPMNWRASMGVQSTSIVIFIVGSVLRQRVIDPAAPQARWLTRFTFAVFARPPPRGEGRGQPPVALERLAEDETD